MTLPRPDSLLVEGCDFDGFPAGGQLSSARQLMAAFGPRLALVGISTDATPVGRWIEKDFPSGRFWFYAVGRRARGAGRPLVPARLSQYLWLRAHRAGVLSLGVRNAFVQAPECLLVVSRWGLDRICHRLPGVENPLTAPRYAWGRPLAGWFDRRVFAALARVDVILASADEAAIAGFVARGRGRIARERIHQLPTHYDSTVFRPADQGEARRALGLFPGGPLLVASGRINRVKGWDLLIDALALLRRRHPGACLAFVGDGEDRGALEARALAAGVAEAVTVTGFQPPQRVALWLAAADVVVVGSHREGWSVAMLEALGCGRPLVSTEVSGAHAMIREGANGFVVEGREPERFADAVDRVLGLAGARDASLEVARDYDLGQMARRIGRVWNVLA